jgi:hypothetical protein
MAAVLCKGCSDICAGACTGCGKICSLPCKIFGECCSAVSQTILSLCDNPFCFYVLVAGGLNIPPISAGVMTIFNGLNNGNGLFGCKIYLWQIVNIILSVVNILAAFYIAVRFNQLRKNPAGSSSGANTQSSGLKKTSDILCHDPIIAIYILVLIGFFIWLCIGVGWKSGGDFECADGGSYALVDTSLGTGFAFLSLGFMALGCSVCCSCCFNGDWKNSNPYYSHNQNSSNNNNSNFRPPATTATANQSSTPYNDVEYATATATPVSGPYSKTPVNATPIQATVVEPSAPPASQDDNNGSAATTAAKIGNMLGDKAFKGFKKAQKLASNMKK